MALQLTDDNTKFWSRPFGLNRSSFTGGAGATMMAWVRVNGLLQNLQSTTSDQSGFVSLGSIATGGVATISSNQDNALNDIFIAEISDDGSDANFSGGGPGFPTFEVGLWICVIALLNVDGSQDLYVSNSSTPGTLVGNGGVQSSPETFDQLTIGWQTPYTNFGSSAFTSSLVNVAEVTVWRGILGSTEALKLFQGANPFSIAPEMLHCYYPLRNDLKDYGPQHIGFTPVGGANAVWVDHPPVALINRRLGFIPSVISPNNNVYFFQPF
jgi:hypothetical protein